MPHVMRELRPEETIEDILFGMRGVALIVAFALAAGGCARRQPEEIRPGAFRNAPLILISIDTLRADHLELYGYKAGSTPNLVQLGRQGIVFEDVYSHVPLTLPAHASLFTGSLPTRHGVRDNIGYTLDANLPTLAGRLKAAGYRTGAAVSSFVLRRQTGIARDFDFFDDRIEVTGSGDSLSESQRDGSQTIDTLDAWIGQASDAPLFAFLHLYEPHTPYAPPPAHRMPQPYDGEVSYADALVGRFLERLRGRGLLDRAVVSIVADHGEGLSDHGEAEHGIFLYREALHVPWVLRLPAPFRFGGTRVGGTVGHVDVTATLLDLVGADVSGLDGHSVVNDLSSGRVTDRSVYSETNYPRLHFGWSDLASITQGRYRFIRAPRPELFDLSSDPRERRNIANQQGATVAALQSLLERTATASPAADPTPASREVRKRLAALGYVSTTARPTRGASLPDPKDTVSSYEALKHAQALASGGRDADAIRELRHLVAAQPTMLDAWEALAKSLVASGQTKDAIQSFGRVLALEPLKAETHLALARIYALERQPAKAREHAQLASERDPAAGNEILAGLAMDDGRLNEAEAFARRSLDVDPSRYVSRFLLGTAAHRQGRLAEAIDEYRRAIDAMKVEPRAVVRNLHAALGDCLARTGQSAEAEREFKTELSLIPTSAEARIGLATLYRSQGRDREARAVLSGLVTATTDAGPDAYATVIRTLTVLGDSDAAREWAARARDRFPRDRRFR
jgi:choline-sulfatase